MPRRADEPETASNHIRPNRSTTAAPVRTRPGCGPSSPQCWRVVAAVAPQISHRYEKSGLDPPDAPLREIEFPKEACFAACYQMRASDVTDRFAMIFSRELGIDEDSILYVALRSLIRYD